MEQNIIELLRMKSLSNLFQLKSIKKAWKEAWFNRITSLIGENPTDQDIINLGDKLRDIFKSSAPTTEATRNQSSLSNSGLCWESLVCWYLNFCLIHTNTVVLRNVKALMPEPLSDALTVTYLNESSNNIINFHESVKSTSEIDLVAITFPEKNNYIIDKYELLSQLRLSSARRNYPLNDVLDKLCADDFYSLNVHVIQCKTNWNDNSQIPLLWDIIYSDFSRTADGLKAEHGLTHKISVGTSHYTIMNLHNFTYSFITTPSNAIEDSNHRKKYTPNQVRVRRVRWLTGHNFWGCETQENVALSIKEIFNKTFRVRLNIGYSQFTQDEKNAILPQI